MPQEKSLHLFPVALIDIFTTFIFSCFGNGLDRTGDEWYESEMGESESGSVYIPFGDGSCFQMAVALQPAPGQGAGGGGCEGASSDQTTTFFEKSLPESREGCACNRRPRLVEEGEEDWILEQSQSNGCG